MQYAISTTTGWRTAEGYVSRQWSHAEIFNSLEELVAYADVYDCEDDEVVICANTRNLKYTLGDLRRLEKTNG